MTTITYEEFERVNFRSSTIVKVEEFLRAKKPVFKVWADFGPEIAVLQTSAQVTVCLITVDPKVPNGQKCIDGSFI